MTKKYQYQKNMDYQKKPWMIKTKWIIKKRIIKNQKPVFQGQIGLLIINKNI